MFWQSFFVYRSYLMTKSLSEYRKSLFISSMSELKRGSVEAFLSNRIFLLLSFSASYTTTRTFLTDLNFLGSLIVNSLFLITYVFSNVIFLNFPKVTKNTRKKSSNFLWSWYKLFYLEQEQSHTNCTILPVLDPINWDCFVRLYRFPSLSRTWFGNASSVGTPPAGGSSLLSTHDSFNPKPFLSSLHTCR